MLKRDFVKRFNMIIIVSIIIFIVSIGAYFYVSLQTQINAVQLSLNTLQRILQDNSGLLGSIKTNIIEIEFIFMAEFITFIAAIIALLSTLWYTTQKYLVEHQNALIDSLTKLYNRKAVFYSLKREIAKTKRYGNALSVAMLDIDYFKKYNDENGHVAGDRLLRRFGRIMKDNLRKFDIYGRYGGEEFIIVFPRTRVEEAYEVCERIRKDMEETRFYGQEKMPFGKVTISIGISEVEGKRRIAKETIIRQADQFLYKAKESGRNQVLYK